jgi:hypothetical protein
MEAHSALSSAYVSLGGLSGVVAHKILSLVIGLYYTLKSSSRCTTHRKPLQKHQSWADDVQENAVLLRDDIASAEVEPSGFRFLPSLGITENFH